MQLNINLDEVPLPLLFMVNTDTAQFLFGPWCRSGLMDDIVGVGFSLSGQPVT